MGQVTTNIILHLSLNTNLTALHTHRRIPKTHEMEKKYPIYGGPQEVWFMGCDKKMVKNWIH